jgi:hypothetical protein
MGITTDGAKTPRSKSFTGSDHSVLNEKLEKDISNYDY